MRVLVLVAVAAMPLATMSAAGAAARPAKVATVVGPPQACVQLQNIRDTNVVDDQTIDFVMRNGTILRNNLPGRCPQLGFERSFTYRTSISQLCSVDIITVLQQGGGLYRGASCGLGKFTPVTLASNSAAPPGGTAAPPVSK